MESRQETQLKTLTQEPIINGDLADKRIVRQGSQLPIMNLNLQDQGTFPEGSTLLAFPSIVHEVYPNHHPAYGTAPWFTLIWVKSNGTSAYETSGWVRRESLFGLTDQIEQQEP